jgi:hypothetical protein
VRVSTRSWVLLFGFIPAPITVAYFRLASLEQRRALATRVRVVLGDFTGLAPDIFVLLGILCLFGFVASILVDYFRSR